MKICPVCFHENPDTARQCVECQSSFAGSQSTLDKTVVRTTDHLSFDPGDIIAGRYRIIRQLGEGGMGAVYLVADLELDEEQCALKMIHPMLVAHPEARQRFRSEVTTSRKLHHNGIIRVFDLGRFDELYFFTMEYLDGRSLADILKTRNEQVPPFSLAEIRQIMTQLLTALGYAHKKTIHRDIKPDNVIVTGEYPDMKIKILDFGIARTMSASRFTQTAQGLGTPYYMAPEQLQNAHAIDHRADLYGVGMILYELLTGAQAIGRFRLPSEILGAAFKPLDELIETALAPGPDQRYRDAGAMLRAFEQAMDQVESASAESTRQKEPLAPGTQEHKESASRTGDGRNFTEHKGRDQPAIEAKKQKTAPHPGPAPAAGKMKYVIIAGVVAVIGVIWMLMNPGYNTEIAEKLKECADAGAGRQWQQAYNCYRAVLVRDRENKDARLGLDKMYNTLLSQGRDALKNDHPETARLVLAQLESFTGAGEAAEQLQEEISRYEEQQAIAEKLKECASAGAGRQWQQAYDCYREVLARDRENNDARRGLDRMYDTLFSQGRDALENDHPETARLVLAQLESFTGAGAAAEQLQEKISRYEEKQTKAKTGKLTFYLTPADTRVELIDGPEYYPGMELPPGRYKFRAFKEGYEDLIGTVQIVPGKEKPVVWEMVPEKGQLIVRPFPRNSRIRILHIKPKYHDKIELLAGRYQIEVSCPGYKTKIMWVQVKADKVCRLPVRLQKISYHERPGPGSTPWPVPPNPIKKLLPTGLQKYFH